uniref:long-chain-fatty-acid--CoA ligase n=1 Tax=Globodera pallida TaxID=36090 RepID=A0A183C491_GLOPA
MDSLTGGKRIEQELYDKERPFYIIGLAAFLKVFFFFYDALVFIPFKIFADPGKKRERSLEQKMDRPQPGDTWTLLGLRFILNSSRAAQLSAKFGTKVYDGLNCMGTREVLEATEERQPDGKNIQKLVLGPYNWLNFEDVDEVISEIAFGLSNLDIKQGQNVVIYSETRKEWMISAMACFKSGLPIVTVYPTLGDEAIAFAMGECDAVLMFTSRSLLPKALSSINNCPQLKRVVYFSQQHTLAEIADEATDEIKQAFNNDGRELYTFNALRALGHSQTKFERNVNADDPAMIMYTSGTTGNPKGVLLSHRNIIATASGQSAVILVNQNDTIIGYLPLAHILEVCAELTCLSQGCRIGYSSTTTLHDRALKIKKGSKGDCGELKPTIIACVPAVLDKIFKAVSEEVKEKSRFKRELFRICYERKRNRFEGGYKSLVMDSLVFDNIGKILGGNLRIVISGGAPLNPETQRFMNICFCCPVVQGYGLTETCGGATLADENDLSTGSVGPPLRCCEIRLREWAEAGYSPANSPPQGEIVIHGANVALGYYKNEEKTNECFIELDGKRWFATGDIGEFREDGSLYIIDRMKDLIKLAHGEYIALGRVEMALLTNPNVDNICVYGNLHSNYLIALVVPNRKKLEALADKNAIHELNWDDVCANKELAKILQKELQKFVSGHLRKEEIPKKVLICKDPWTPDSGLLTEALKLKRKNIELKFGQEIKQLYEEN